MKDALPADCPKTCVLRDCKNIIGAQAVTGEALLENGGIALTVIRFEIRLVE